MRWYDIYNSRNLMVRLNEKLVMSIQPIYNSRNLMVRLNPDELVASYLASTTVEI